MKRHRHTPEQTVRKRREGERLLNEGAALKLLNIIDEHTREALVMDVHVSLAPTPLAPVWNVSSPKGASRRICGWTTGPKLIAWVLGDWCHRSGPRHHL